ncbi:hypothetical protein CDL15_Pgr023782 [Punica granatum]|uniref:Uncharacterized protein n=1 Tax=Punica granatum TaxID=22663 RepID=A0A218WSR5_PUNGR|nr:hypothetical protein CDL15_Pgr023782 [Punica granatum]
MSGIWLCGSLLKGGCDPFWSYAKTKRKEKAWGNALPQAKRIHKFTPAHPILAHRLPTRGLPTEARDTIHRPAIRGKYAGTDYSPSGNLRQIGGHEDMNNGRRARSLRKAEESHQKNERTRNLENDGTGTVALFITESPKYRKVPNMGLQKSLSVPK